MIGIHLELLRHLSPAPWTRTNMCQCYTILQLVGVTIPSLEVDSLECYHYTTLAINSSFLKKLEKLRTEIDFFSAPPFNFKEKLTNRKNELSHDSVLSYHLSMPLPVHHRPAHRLRTVRVATSTVQTNIILLF